MTPWSIAIKNLESAPPPPPPQDFRKCPCCGVLFELILGKIYCSAACRKKVCARIAKAKRKTTRTNKKAVPIEPLPMVECKWCGETFSLSGVRKYCGDECYAKWRNAERREAKKAERERLGV